MLGHGRCASDLSITLGGLDAGQLAAVRASVFAGGREAALTPGESGAFSASVGPLCEALAAALSCGSSVETSMRVRVTFAGGVQPLERDVPVQVAAVACTPTPVPTATLTPTPRPTPTPAPTPVPDSDGDGVNDLSDQCVDEAGWAFAPWGGSSGCPPPLAAKVAGALAGAGLLAFLGFYVAPAALVATVRQPPAGYVQVYRNGKAEGSYKSLRSLGQAARKSTITIGSKGLLQVQGMEPVELRVERRGSVSTVLRGPSGPQLFQIRDIPSMHTASGGNGIVLKFSTDPKQLR